MPDAPPRAFVAGWPIAHSRSPLIHGYWLKQFGLAGSYERIAISPETADAFFSDLGSSGFIGGNVTVPHKEIAFNCATRTDAVAEVLGAVNTLWMDGEDICATNTDAHGFIANLDECAPGWDKSSRKAIVLGAGGAARAVIWGLVERGLSVAIVNRNLERAETVARLFAGTSAFAWDVLPELLLSADLLVNTTPLGMPGRPVLEIDLRRLHADALVTDIVYVPLITPLLAAANARGLKTVDGLGMLLHQAVPGFERWFGVRPDVTPELRALIVGDLIGNTA